MTKRIKALMFCAIILVCALFAAYRIVMSAQDVNYAPAIHIGERELHVSVNDDERRLLEGVTAYDEEDGDLTESIILESVSDFISEEGGVCIATYVVVDSDRNVSKGSRRIVFDDYASPEFTLSKPLVFDYGYAFDVLDPVGAVDCFDGDISSTVKMSLIGAESISSAGNYQVKYYVTNSYGDTAEITLPVTIYQRTSAEIRYQPVIGLSKYLVYLENGDTFRPEAYIESMTINAVPVELTADMISDIEVATNLDVSVPGVYTVEYRYTGDNGYTGTTRQFVVIGE